MSTINSLGPLLYYNSFSRERSQGHRPLTDKDITTVTPEEREELDRAFATPATAMPAKGQPIDHTLESWKYLASTYANTIVDMRDEISRLKRKINKLEQKGGGYVGLDK